MKRLFTLIIVAIALISNINAQTPYMFKYQAVARTNDGNPISNETVAFRISVLQGNETGSEVFSETHSLLTNNFGLISFNIGAGNLIAGDLSTINWSSDIYFVKVEMDDEGGSDYEHMSTSQLLSVPYAMHAKTAENVFSGNYNDLTNAPDLSGYDTNASDDFDGDYNSLINTPDLSGYDNNVADDFNGDYTSLVNAPDFTGWDTDASNDFDGDYNSLINTPEMLGWDTDASDDFSGNYNDLSNKPTIPLVISDLTNDAGYITNPVTTTLTINSELNRPSTGSANLVPIAYGFIAQDGTIETSSGNISCVWNASLSRYEITIASESYFWNDYITNVTGAYGPRFFETSSAGGNLIISVYDTSGNPTQTYFQFVVYKP
ncbi:MAG: hypothetical protein JXR58_09730 [Bacteroidales bacterium]|nr:hypothetical protein [Bacteroidales bacterium]